MRFVAVYTTGERLVIEATSSEDAKAKAEEAQDNGRLVVQIKPVTGG